jgi:hypothetical protein
MIMSPLGSLHAPKLEFIEICCFGDIEENTAQATIFSGGAPILRAIDLSSVNCFPLNSRTLSTVSLHAFPGSEPILSGTQFHQLLKNILSLTSLTLIGEVMRVSRMFGVTAVDLPRLASLTIIPAEDYDACILITPICVSYICYSLPTTNLHHLYISDMTKKISNNFMSFLRQGTSPRFPNVVSLWWETKLSESDAVDLMVAFPKLERLALYSFQSDGFLKALAKRDNNNDRSPAEGSCRLPQLTTIGIYWATLKVLRKVVSSCQKISISIRRI